MKGDNFKTAYDVDSEMSCNEHLKRLEQVAKISNRRSTAKITAKYALKLQWGYMYVSSLTPDEKLGTWSLLMKLREERGQRDRLLSNLSARIESKGFKPNSIISTSFRYPCYSDAELVYIYRTYFLFG